MANCDKATIKIYGNTGLSTRVAQFQQKAEKHKEKQATNPFSGEWKGPTVKNVFDKSDPRYGRPEEGSKTEKRGQKAGQLINNEMRLLCDLINEYGEKMEDGSTVIMFGELFMMYTRISNKVVGLLMRARKHGFLQFEGEMLYQGRDDKVPITMLKSIEELRAMFEQELAAK